MCSKMKPKKSLARKVPGKRGRVVRGRGVGMVKCGYQRLDSLKGFFSWDLLQGERGGENLVLGNRIFLGVKGKRRKLEEYDVFVGDGR